MRPKRPKRRRSSAIYAPSLPSVRPPSILTPTANVTMPPHSDRKRSTIVCLVASPPLWNGSAATEVKLAAAIYQRGFRVLPHFRIVKSEVCIATMTRSDKIFKINPSELIPLSSMDPKAGTGRLW